VDAMFKAFSDGTRLRILHLLLGGEMCVGDLVTILEVPQPRTSQHLAALRSSGLVTSRRDGLWSFYSLAEPKSNFHKKLLECLRHCFSEVPELQADHRRAAKLAKSAPCCPPAKPRSGSKPKSG
jgi:ArsR family transcriptional regulator